MRGDGPGDGPYAGDSSDRHSDDPPQKTVTAENRIDKGNTGHNDGRDGDDGDMRAFSKPQGRAARNFSQDVRQLFKNPPEWMKAQARICREKGSPKSLTEPLAAAVSARLYGNPEHKEDVLPAVEAQLHPLDCECAECL